MSSIENQRKTRLALRLIPVTFLLGCLAAVFLFPLVLTVSNAFMSKSEIDDLYGGPSGSWEADHVRLRLIPEHVTLSQLYDVLVGTPRYLYQFWNSIFLVVPIMAGHMAVGSMAAYAFARLRFRGRDPLFFLYIVTMLMPYQVTLVPNFLIADFLGLVGHYSSIILPGVFQTFGVFLLRQFMAFIPEETIDAAKVDGAGHWTIFTRIILPLSKSGLASLAILLFMENWNMVEQPLVFLRDNAMHPLSVFLSEVNKSQIGVAFAAAAVYMLPMVLVYLYGEKHLIQGIRLSGISGVREQ